MAGSQPAAETRNGEAVARSGDCLRRFFVLSSLAVGALAACSSPVTPPAAVTPVAAAEVLAPPESAPAEPAAMRLRELSILTGMDPAQLIALLGEPDLRRREPPAELWQYRNADCVLDVFLYGEGASCTVRRATATCCHRQLPDAPRPSTDSREKAGFSVESRGGRRRQRGASGSYSFIKFLKDSGVSPVLGSYDPVTRMTR